VLLAVPVGAHTPLLAQVGAATGGDVLAAGSGGRLVATQENDTQVHKPSGGAVVAAAAAAAAALAGDKGGGGGGDRGGVGVGGDRGGKGGKGGKGARITGVSALDWSEQASYMRARATTLDFGGFLSLLVHAAHARANPPAVAAASTASSSSGGTAAAPSQAWLGGSKAGARRAHVAVPEALGAMLEDRLLPQAARDPAQALTEAIVAGLSDELREIVRERRATLQTLWREARRSADPPPDPFAPPVASSHGIGGGWAAAAAATSQHRLALGEAAGAPDAAPGSVSAEEAVRLLTARGVLRLSHGDRKAEARAREGLVTYSRRGALDAEAARELFIDTCPHHRVSDGAASHIRGGMYFIYA